MMWNFRRMWHGLITVAVAAVVCAGTLPVTAQAAARPIDKLLAQPLLRKRGVRMRAMGLVPSSARDFQRSARIRVTPGMRGERPNSVLLTDFLPPIGDQKSQNSCVGWSTAYYCYSYSVAKKRQLTPEQRLQAKFQFSPSYVYHLGNDGKDEGMSIATAFQILKARGCASLAEMPFQETDYTSKPSAEADARANRYQAEKIGYISSNSREVNPEELKTFLASTQLPVVLAIPIFSDFPETSKDSNFVYDLSVQPTRENVKGYHAITIIGYDDARKAFRMVNSWGKSWGDGGLLWLSEKFIANCAFEAWGQLPGGVAARNPRVTIEEPMIPAARRAK